MNNITIKDLKEKFSFFSSKAASGETIIVSRYNKPYIQMIKANSGNLHIGKKSGKSLPVLNFKLKTNGKMLEELEKDRG